MKRKVGRNEPCPCGSGKKYKHCCWGKRFEWLVDDDGNFYREVPIDDPELLELLHKCETEFRERHGRTPYADELIFRDLGHPEHMEAMMVNIMKRAGIDPAFIYAYEKIGFIVTSQNKDKLPDVDLLQWKEAIEEYYSRVERGDKPDI